MLISRIACACPFLTGNELKRSFMENFHDKLGFIGQGVFVAAMLRKVLQRIEPERTGDKAFTGSLSSDYDL